MLYDGNLYLRDLDQELKPLDFDIIELIKRNEAGLLNHVFGKGRVVPFSISHVSERINSGRKPIVGLPGDGDCFYCITNPDDEKAASGGFVYDQGNLYFASKLANLAHDRDAYRQIPSLFQGTYFTDVNFRQVVESFAKAQVPLFRTIDEIVYYDKKYNWPDRLVPNLGKIDYEEAFRILKV